MDAPDAESDVKLQKASAELIADLDRSLRGFARRKPDVQGRPRVRSFVRAKETLQATTTVGDRIGPLELARHRLTSSLRSSTCSRSCPSFWTPISPAGSRSWRTRTWSSARRAAAPRMARRRR